MRRSRCYICHTRGHAYWNCPNMNRRRDFARGKQTIDGFQDTAENYQVIGSDGKGWNEIWYVSDIHPRHMTPNLEVFEKFKRDSASSSITGKSGMDVQGLGEVIVQTESHKFVIPGVFYVPNRSLNILSLTQLVQQGFDVTFKDSKCLLRSMFDTTSSEEMEEEDSGKRSVTSDKIEVEEKARDEPVEEQGGLDQDKEKAIRAIMRYYDALYFKDTIIATEEENSQTPSKNDFESLIGFLHMVNEQEIHEGCKDLVAEHFEKLVKWFYKNFMHIEERPTPVKINNANICLLDLYLTVKNMGGHARVSIKQEWFHVAHVMGLPKEFADELKECYSTHLSLMAAYYAVAREYSVDELVQEALECVGTSGVLKDENEETTQDRDGLEEMRMEQDDEDGIQGKVEYDDGDTLIMSFEGSQASDDNEKHVVRDTDKEDDIIVID